MILIDINFLVFLFVYLTYKFASNYSYFQKKAKNNFACGELILKYCISLYQNEESDSDSSSLEEEFPSEDSIIVNNTTKS